MREIPARNALAGAGRRFARSREEPQLESEPAATAPREG